MRSLCPLSAHQPAPRWDQAWCWVTWMTQAFTLEHPLDWPRKHRQFCFPGQVLGWGQELVGTQEVAPEWRGFQQKKKKGLSDGGSSLGRDLDV